MPVIGWREWVELPAFEVPTIKVKVDTGARTSSLHAFDLEEFRKRGEPWVRFSIHPEQKSARHATTVAAPLHDRRLVKPSSGRGELRPVIVTTIALLGEVFEAELTLTRRDQMGFRMLLGRQATRGRFLVDPGASFLNGRRIRKTRRLRPRRNAD